MQSFAHQLLAIQTPSLEPRSAPQPSNSSAKQRDLRPATSASTSTTTPTTTPTATSASSPSSTQHIPCKFFRSGQCQAGDKCSFSHTTEHSAASPLYCKYYAKGHCKFGSKCALPHINDQRPTSAPASSSSSASSASTATNNASLSLSMTQLNSRNSTTPSPSTTATARSALSSYQHQLQHQQHLYQDDPHTFYDGATTPTPTTPVPVPASPNANNPRSLAAAHGLSSSASLSHRLSVPGGMVGSPGAHLSASFGPGSLDSMPSVPANTPLDHHHHLLEHYQQQQHMAQLQQQQQQQQLAHSHGSAAGFLHARRERAMSLRRQSSMLGFDASTSGVQLSGSLPAGAAGWAGGMSPSSVASTTPTPFGQLAAAAQQRASIMSTSSYGTSPSAAGNMWQAGGLGSASSYDPPAPHLMASGSLPRASMMGAGNGAGMPGIHGGAPRSRLSASFLPGAAPASVPSRLSFSALGGGAGPYYGAESDDYSEPGFDVVGMGSASYMGGVGVGGGASSLSLSGHFGHTNGNTNNHTGSRLSSLSDDYDAHSFHSGGAADQLEDDDTVSAGILPASLSDLLTPIEQRRFASQRTALPASSAPGSGFARFGGGGAPSLHTAHAPGTTVHGFNVRPMSTASSSSEIASPTNDIRKSDSAVAFDEDGVFAMQDLESALPGAAATAAPGGNPTMTPSTSSSTVGGTSNATSSGQSTPWSHMHMSSSLTGGGNANTNGSGHSSPAQPTSRRPSGPSPWAPAAATASPKGLPMLCVDHVRHGQCPGGCGKVHGLQCPVCGLHLLHPMAPHEEHHRHIQECLAAPLNGAGAGSAADQMMRGQQQNQMQNADMWRS